MTEDSPHDFEDSELESEAITNVAKVFQAEEIFGQTREVWIVLDGVRYRLRITRRGKLILQK